MKVAVGSAFRNMGPRVMLYMERVAALRDALPNDTLRVIAAEGDSTDNTRDALKLAADYHDVRLNFVECSHGQRIFGSTEEADRMIALSKVGNAIFEGVQDDDVLVYIESDLVWDAATIISLIHNARERTGGYDVFAPIVMAGKAFYDIWGFRGMDGERWIPFFPYHKECAMQDPEHGTVYPAMVEMSSVGSCLVMQGCVARVCRIRRNYCLVDWCEDARYHGYRIAARLDKIVRQL